MAQRNHEFLKISLLAILIAGCGDANKVTVSGLVKDNAGNAVADAQIQIIDTFRCCAGEEKPCTYKSDASGHWSLFMNLGVLVKDAPEASDICQYTVSKNGFNSVTGSFSYCIHGACAGDQKVSTEVVLSP